MAQGFIDPRIFESLQGKIDEETAVRDRLKEIVQALEKHVRASQALLARVHSTPSSELEPILAQVAAVRETQAQTMQRLAEAAGAQPYYKYCNTWSRQVQDAASAAMLARWLSGAGPSGEGSGGGAGFSGGGHLLTLEETGAALGGIPVDVRDRDVFHLTVEEYLQALIGVVDELARLAVNSVTLGDYARPPAISAFVKDVHAGFQLLNLKNDSLRRRSDGIKYSVKKVEDVVYDLSLRNLLPPPPAAAPNQEKMES